MNINNLNPSLRSYLFPETESELQLAMTQPENARQSDPRISPKKLVLDYKQISEDPGQLFILLRLLSIFVNYDFILREQTYQSHFNNIFNKTFITKIGKMIHEFQPREVRASIVEQKVYATTLEILEKFATLMNDKSFAEMCYILGRLTRR